MKEQQSKLFDKEEKPKPKKPETQPEEEDEEEDEGIGKRGCQITVGDINIASRTSNLNIVRNTLTDMLKDKSIKNYLNRYDRKKFTIPLGVG